MVDVRAKLGKERRQAEAKARKFGQQLKSAQNNQLGDKRPDI